MTTTTVIPHSYLIGGSNAGAFKSLPDGWQDSEFLWSPGREVGSWFKYRKTSVTFDSRGYYAEVGDTQYEFPTTVYVSCEDAEWLHADEARILAEISRARLADYQFAPWNPYAVDACIARKRRAA